MIARIKLCSLCFIVHPILLIVAGERHSVAQEQKASNTWEVNIRDEGRFCIACIRNRPAYVKVDMRSIFVCCKKNMFACINEYDIYDCMVLCSIYLNGTLMCMALSDIYNIIYIIYVFLDWKAKKMKRSNATEVLPSVGSSTDVAETLPMSPGIMNIQPPQDSQPVESQAPPEDSQPLPEEPMEDLGAPEPKVDAVDQGGVETMGGEGEHGEEEPRTDDEVVEPVISHELADILQQQEQQEPAETDETQQQDNEKQEQFDTQEIQKECKPPTPADAIIPPNQAQVEKAKGKHVAAATKQHATVDIAKQQPQEPQKKEPAASTMQQEQAAPDPAIPCAPPLSPCGVMADLDSDEEGLSKEKVETTSKGTFKDRGQLMDISIGPMLR